MSSLTCPFCDRLQQGHLLASNDLAAAFLDAYPLNPGHALIVPRRHESDFFALSEVERRAMWLLVDEVRGAIQEEHQPDGYNIGANAGAAAGQTIEHAHIHVIPRYRGDVEDPRGGIRRVLLGLIDLCLENTTTSDAPPDSLTTRQLAEKIVEIYWPQATVYSSGQITRVLKQNAGKPDSGDPTVPLAQARREAAKAFERLVRSVERSITSSLGPAIPTTPSRTWSSRTSAVTATSATSSPRRSMWRRGEGGWSQDPRSPGSSSGWLRTRLGSGRRSAR